MYKNITNRNIVNIYLLSLHIYGIYADRIVALDVFNKNSTDHL